MGTEVDQQRAAAGAFEQHGVEQRLVAVGGERGVVLEALSVAEDHYLAVPRDDAVVEVVVRVAPEEELTTGDRVNLAFRVDEDLLVRGPVAPMPPGSQSGSSTTASPSVVSRRSTMRCRRADVLLARR